MRLEGYIENISKRYKLGNFTEHTFRGDLQELIESIVPGVAATNEPQRQSCGAPDYILTRRDIPIGFIEAKNIGDSDLDGLKKTGNKEQFDRYKSSLGNLIFTDYLNFHFYQEGLLVNKVSIGDVQNGKILPIHHNFEPFEVSIKDFCTYVGQSIKSPKKLAEMMAHKAKLLSNIIEQALKSDESNQENSTLKDQMIAFREILIHDITPKGFADVYAQTIAYGMFAARLHDTTLSTFGRQEAAELIPKSNPFLRKLFGYIAGPDLDDRIKWIVDSLVEIFQASDVGEILTNYGKATKTEDPIIHFYETFLSEFDPQLRKSRGVWYTPHPVVNFIVRAVDEALKREFCLHAGLADTSKVKLNIELQGKKATKEVHKVQILDPATGTGTFLAEIIRQIYKGFKGQQGNWCNYVEQHLLPRLNGFEILMASYAMAHLKLNLVLTETGYQSQINQRLKVYLTNTLEEYHSDTGTLFANWLSAEANEANQLKRDIPVMIVIGNPPYSGESSNKGKWVMSLMEDYKKEPGGKLKLKERNPKWINDDYVKFTRYGQYLIEKNGNGILAFILPHGFLDNPTFRGVRWNLLKTYDKIYTLDLHGNSNKKETSPDGSIDENVFDIMQGVSINLFIKTGNKKASELGKVFQCNIFGKRESKYEFLINNSLNTIDYKELPNIAPLYLFKQKDYLNLDNYNKGFSIANLFTVNSAGIVTARDSFTIHFSEKDVQNTILEFAKLDDDIARSKFSLGKDVRDWSVSSARKDLMNTRFDFSNIVNITYRPFDKRFTYFTGNTKGFHCMPRGEVMKHMFKKENISLICPKQVPEQERLGVHISKFISGHKTCSAYNINNIFPLYLYPDISGHQIAKEIKERTPNLNKDIIVQFSNKLDLTFTNEKVATVGTFAPIDIFDYIYAVLHSPTYRVKYSEFFKTDFPRIPFPMDAVSFWKLVRLGEQLRQIQLLESPVVSNFITAYPINGSNKVLSIRYHHNRLYINESQYFENISEDSWNFNIGGYRPAQKWLTDRKGRILEFEEILHYQKIIVALVETQKIMDKINVIQIE